MAHPTYRWGDILAALAAAPNPTAAAKLIGMARGAMVKRCKKEGGQLLAEFNACRKRGHFHGKRAA